MEKLIFNLELRNPPDVDLPEQARVAYAAFVLANCVDKIEQQVVDIVLGTDEILLATPYQYRITVELMSRGQRIQ